MILTDFQKSVVKDILSETVIDIESFIKRHVKIESDRIKTNTYIQLISSNGYAVGPNQEIFKVMDEKERYLRFGNSLCFGINLKRQT